MIYKFLEYIKEIFNTKNYKWIKSDLQFRKIAYFETSTNKKYYLYIDEIKTNVYNIYFYYEKNGEKIIKLLKDGTGDEFEILSNIKHSVDEFINNTEDIEFIGYSGFEDERHDLYCMFLKHISSSKRFVSYWKKIGKITYYFLKENNVPDMLASYYETDFIKYDKKNKKY